MKPLYNTDSGNNLIQEDVVAFLKNVPPFSSLDQADLRYMADNLYVEFYAKGDRILKQNDAPSDALHIIKKGGIKISVMSPQDNSEVIVDYRGEGDSFGFLSLVSGNQIRANFTAVDDTICYLLGKEPFLQLMDTHRSLTEYFLKSHISKYIDQTSRELQNRSIFHGGSDRFLFTTKVSDLAVKDMITTSEDTTIQEAAGIMAQKRISSIVIMDSSNHPAGIVTDRDLRQKVVAQGRNMQEPVKNIMNAPLITVDTQDVCFEIALKMIKHNIHHVIVSKEGVPSGVVTNHDLMMLQGTSPLSLTKDIENQQTIDGLIPVSKKINSIVGLLLKEGAKASNIAKVITEINDRLVCKIIELAEKNFGRPPLPYCWITFGSEGRREQTFKTDQDNALLYADPATEAEAFACERYFSSFSSFVRDGLAQCGFPVCPANNMASNPEWRRPLKIWKKYFTNWISTPTPEAVLKSVTFFDFRPLYGDFSFADALRDHLNMLLTDRTMFLSHLANLAIHNAPPIGFLKSFVVEKGGEHKDQLNLKVKGLASLIDIIRLFALEKGIRETSTLGRIEALRSVHTIVADYADELEHAFELIMLLRIHHQFVQINSGRDPDNFIYPNQLSNLEKRSIKEAFHIITRLQNVVIERYKPLIW